MDYNQKRHKQLVIRSQDFKNLEKSFYQESKDEYLELSKYEGAIQSYLYQKSRTLFVLTTSAYVNQLSDKERQKRVDQLIRFQ